jgi:Na+-translocating ferredoxin:NAD+ oxidoreductase subunit G
MGSFKDSNLSQAWLVLLLSLIFSISLAAVHIKLNPLIEENKTKETMEKIPVLVTGEDNTVNSDENKPSLTIKQRSIKSEKQGTSKSYMVYDAFDNTGKVIGHVVKASGQGYADKIELLLGFDSQAEKITGIFILNQKETPGLGNKIVEEKWNGQYKGKSSVTPLVVIKGKSKNDNEIDAVSGATISSRSVTDIINSTISDVKTEIALAPESNIIKENK